MKQRLEDEFCLTYLKKKYQSINSNCPEKYKQLTDKKIAKIWIIVKRKEFNRIKFE